MLFSDERQISCWANNQAFPVIIIVIIIIIIFNIIIIINIIIMNFISNHHLQYIWNLNITKTSISISETDISLHRFKCCSALPLHYFGWCSAPPLHYFSCCSAPPLHCFGCSAPPLYNFGCSAPPLTTSVAALHHHCTASVNCCSAQPLHHCNSWSKVIHIIELKIEAFLI